MPRKVQAWSLKLFLEVTFDFPWRGFILLMNSQFGYKLFKIRGKVIEICHEADEWICLDRRTTAFASRSSGTATTVCQAFLCPAPATLKTASTWDWRWSTPSGRSFCAVLFVTFISSDPAAQGLVSSCRTICHSRGRKSFLHTEDD